MKRNLPKAFPLTVGGPQIPSGKNGLEYLAIQACADFLWGTMQELQDPLGRDWLNSPQRVWALGEAAGKLCAPENVELIAEHARTRGTWRR